MSPRETPDASELSRRRRAIHRGLSRFIQGDRLMELLCLWEERYSDLPPFELLTFLDAVCTTPQCRQRRKDIHLALVQSMLLPLDRLGPDPWPEMRQFLKQRTDAPTGDHVASEPPAGGTADSAAPAGRVFWAVLEHMLRALAAEDPERETRVRADLAAALHGQSPDAASARTLSGWLVADSVGQQQLLNQSFLPWALHQAYVIACRHYGPKSADQALNQGIRIAEQLAEARTYAPKQLL